MTDKKQNRYWGDQTPPSSKVEFFNATTTVGADGESATTATIRLYGPIDSWGGWWGVSTKDVAEVLDALPETVTSIVLRINSPGGHVFEALAILNMFRAHRASVTAVVDGLAASAASFLAAGCDETVMSPGTQMMLHSPSNIAWGNAREMRKMAETLDNLEASIVELYTAKAGEKDWATILAEETWLTAQASVDLGLADRIAVIPDAGEAETVGADDDLLLITVDPEIDEEAEDTASRVIQLHGRAAAAVLNRLPSSSEPGNTNRKEEAVAYSDLKAGLAQRLGVNDADPTDETLLAAADKVIAERASDNTAVPDGAIVVDKTVFEQLQGDASAGREAMNAITAQRRDSLVADALRDGRITASSKDEWRADLDANEESVTRVLNRLPKNAAVPMVEIGHSDDIEDSAENALYGRIGYLETKEA